MSDPVVEMVGASGVRERCKLCNRSMVYPSGPVKSPYLLVGEFPGKEELIQGRPFVGPSGDILRTELLRIGLPITMFRMTNLWLHAANPKKLKLLKNEKTGQVDWLASGGCDPNLHITQLAKEIKGRKAVLLMGSDLCKAMFGMSVMELTGLEQTNDKFPGIRFMVSPNPAQLMHGPVGEFRLALGRFKEMIE